MTSVVFEVPGTNITARQAAQEFANEFDPPRTVVWHIDGRFHFEKGVKTYAVRPMPNGWRISIWSDQIEA
jgi:hypothetical protein